MGINKALQTIQGELVNNTLRLTEIKERLEKESKKLEEVENDGPEHRKTSKEKITKKERSSGASCKDKTNHWKGP